MNLLYILLCVAFGLAYYWVRFQWHKRMTVALEYRYEFSTDEIFEGDYFYLEQVIVNRSDKDVSFLKMETTVPFGMRIVLVADDIGQKRDELLQTVQGIFTIPAHAELIRRFRVISERRGFLDASSVQLHVIVQDVLGMSSYSCRLQPQPSAKGTLLVLPKPTEVIKHMALSPTYAGELTKPRGILADPMVFCGIREYEMHDSLNMVDWKQTARLGQMMVRKNETQINDCFNIVLNMQSVPIEPNPPHLSSPQLVEECISICCSLLDTAIRRNIPVRLMANTEPQESIGTKLSNDEIGGQIFASDEFASGDSVLQAYRMLSVLPMQMSVPTEALLDDIVTHPETYVRGEHIVFVSCYFDGRLLEFHRTMKEMGYRVVFYAMSAFQNPIELPEDLELYYRWSEWKGGR